MAIYGQVATHMVYGDLLFHQFWKVEWLQLPQKTKTEGHADIEVTQQTVESLHGV